MSTRQEWKQPLPPNDTPRMPWHVLYNPKVLGACLCVSAITVGLTLWQMDGSRDRLRQDLAKQSESFRKLEPLIAQHGGNVRKAMLALAGKTERTNDDAIVELSFDYSEILDDELVHLREFPELRVLSLAGTKITDRGLRSLSQLTNLRSLSLYYTTITDKGLQHLRDCRRLQFINLVGTSATGQGVSELQDLPELETLILELAPLTDAHLETLKRFQKLTTLDLIGTKLTEEGIAELRAALPDCLVYGP